MEKRNYCPKPTQLLTSLLVDIISMLSMVERLLVSRLNVSTLTLGTVGSAEVVVLA